VSQGSIHDDDVPKAPGVRPEAMSSLLKELLVQGTARDQASRGEAAPGSMVGRFELVRELGRGGFGVVYEARDVQLQRSVAVKLLRIGEAGLGEQLQREAELVARLSHPNLVTLHDVGLSPQGPYLVLELLKGQTLQQRLDAGPLPVAEALRIAVEVARGLAYAHSEGVVHRDLKPSNVFITTRGAVKLLDFGMAHAFGRRRVSGGTPAYMAPEQWEENPEDERTDVFALGVMLHRMLTGQYPFPEDGGRWSSGPAEPVTLEVPGAPELGRLVGRCMQRVPKARPRDGAEVLAALEGIKEALPATAVGAPLPRPTRKKATLAELLAELKRRRVFRVMAGYGIFAFAVLQVIEPIMHGAHLGDWVLTAALVALAVGFPVAVILSWVFDFTADGVVRTPSATGGPRLSRGRVAALLVGVGLMAALPGLGWYAWKHGRGAVVTEPGSASIAVLPFDDLSPGHDQDYFSDGVAGEILNALSRVEGLRVPGRASSFWFKGKRAEPAEVASKLGVAHLLEGSVRRSGKKLRIDAEVIRTADGSRLWAQTFEKEEADIFAVQDEIARAVVASLKVKLLSGQDAPPPPVVPTTSPETYSQYLLGKSLFYLGSPEGYRRAVEAYREALKLDDRYAPAWAGLAVAASYASSFSRTPSEYDQHLKYASGAGAKAVELAPGLPEALAARGYSRAMLSHDWAGGQEDLEKAIELAPRVAEFHRLLASFALMPQGKLREGIEEARRAVDLDPGSSLAWNSLGLHLINDGQFPKGQEALEEALRISPDQSFAALNLTKALALQGKGEAALRQAERAVSPGRRLTAMTFAHAALGQQAAARNSLAELERGFGELTPYQVAVAYAMLGDRGGTLDWLERSLARRDREMALQVRVDRTMLLVRNEPRYLAVLRALNLAPADGPAPLAVPTTTPSIAVLAFEDLSEKHDQGYFADGVAEEILNALAHVDGLRVPGRTSSFWFKGKNARLAEIGRELSVSHVLEGSVRRAGKRVRVTAQVVNVADGGHLWSETFDRPEGDLFAVQDEVARAVVAALQVKLLPGAPRPAAAARTENLEAYEQYLIGNQFLLRFTTPDVAAAVGALEKAIKLDPTLASAWARLSVALWWQGQSHDRSVPARAVAAAERAVALDPSLAMGHAALARVRDDFLLDFAGADVAIARALALDPANIYVLSSACAIERTRGRFRASAAACQKGIDLDPLTVGARNQLGWTLLAMNDLKRARAVNARTLEISPGAQAARQIRCQLDLLERRWTEAEDHCLSEENRTEAMFYRAALRSVRGTRTEADAALAELMAGGGGKSPFLMAELYAWRGEVDQAFQWLERAADERDGISDLKSDVFLRPLRGTPRFVALLKKLKLPID
jgi:TolB-like protein/cytochrome c-type biogenesis protein CcmH/NrfG